MRVAVGGMKVAVEGTGVNVSVDGIGVDVGEGVVGAPHPSTSKRTTPKIVI